MTSKEHIINYLKNRDWTYGGTIEIDVSGIAKTKSSVVRRRLQENASNDPNSLKPLIKRFVDNPAGSGPKVVQYKLNPLVFGNINHNPKAPNGRLVKTPYEVQNALFEPIKRRREVRQIFG